MENTVEPIKVLNLYAGIGGNRKLWENVKVTAVEIDPDIAKIYSHFYPDDELIIGDAHEYLIKNYDHFDFIWASPPCPSHSTMSTALKGQNIVRYPDMNLYQEIILLKHFFKGKWVVENVQPYYKTLIDPYIKLCRHLFWSNFHIFYSDMDNPMKGLLNSVSGETAKYQEILGIDIRGFSLPGQNKKRTVLRNCVLPELGKHIFDCAVGSIIKEDQLELFS